MEWEEGLELCIHDYCLPIFSLYSQLLFPVVNFFFIDHTVQLTIFSFIHTLNHGAPPPFFARSVPVASIRKCRFELYPIISFSLLLPPLYSPIPSSLSPSSIFVSVTLSVCGPSCVIRRIHPWNFALVRKSEGASLLPPSSLSSHRKLRMKSALKLVDIQT